MGAVAAALAIPLILFVLMLDDIIKAWHNGKTNTEAQKTLGLQSLERAEEHKTRQQELKLERAKLTHSVHAS